MCSSLVYFFDRALLVSKNIMILVLFGGGV